MSLTKRATKGAGYHDAGTPGGPAAKRAGVGFRPRDMLILWGPEQRRTKSFFIREKVVRLSKFEQTWRVTDHTKCELRVLGNTLLRMGIAQPTPLRVPLLRAGQLTVGIV